MKRMCNVLSIMIIVTLFTEHHTSCAKAKKKSVDERPHYTTTVVQEEAASQSYSTLHNATDNTSAGLHPKPIVPTSAHPISILATIQKELQDPQYQSDILPHNFSYPRQLLRFGAQTKKSPEYAQQVLSLFSKLLKGSEYVNSYVYSDFIRELPDLLKPYLCGYQVESSGALLLANDMDMFDRLQKTVSHLVFNKFSQDFEVCKTNPRLFLDDLSNRIIATTTQEINIELLRQMVIRFLEVGLSKLVWSPRDEEKTWESVKTLSHNLAVLMEHNIISDLNDLDELYWSLLHRYRYFLELNSTAMSISFYETIKHDISSNKILLLDLEEQEPFLQTKSSCLLNTILSQEAKKRLYTQVA